MNITTPYENYFFYQFELWQNEMMVANTSSKRREDALNDIKHYAMMFKDDGPLKIYQVTRTPIEL